MIHPARLAIATVALVFAAELGPAIAQTSLTSGGPVDPALIEDLVAANRILAEEGVLDAYGHVSIRHPNDPNRYLMSRSRAPSLVTASDIMEYDLDSNPIDPQDRRSVIERFIHGEIYKLRPDVKAVIHSHSPAVIPFGITQVPMRPVAHVASFLWVGVPVWDSRDAHDPASAGMLVRNAARKVPCIEARRQTGGADARAWQCRGRSGRADCCPARDLHRGERPIADDRDRDRRSDQLYLCGGRYSQRCGGYRFCARLGALEKESPRKVTAASSTPAASRARC